MKNSNHGKLRPLGVSLRLSKHPSKTTTEKSHGSTRQSHLLSNNNSSYHTDNKLSSNRSSVKSTWNDILSPDSPADASEEDIVHKYARGIKVFVFTDRKLEHLTALLKLDNPWEFIPPDALAIFEACMFLVYGKVIPTWQILQTELKYREDLFLQDLSSFDKTTMIIKKMNERQFQRIKEAMESVDISGMKKNVYYGIMRALKSWAKTHLQFYEDWVAAFENHILKS